MYQVFINTLTQKNDLPLLTVSLLGSGDPSYVTLSRIK